MYFSQTFGLSQKTICKKTHNFSQLEFNSLATKETELYCDNKEDLCFLKIHKVEIQLPQKAIIHEKTFGNTKYFEEYFTMSKVISKDFTASNGFLVN